MRTMRLGSTTSEGMLSVSEMADSGIGLFFSDVVAGVVLVVLVGELMSQAGEGERLTEAV